MFQRLDDKNGCALGEQPSRSTSHGRDARSGSSLRRLMACIWAKLAIGSGWMTPSVPPRRNIGAAQPQHVQAERDRLIAGGAGRHGRALQLALRAAEADVSAAEALAISMGMANGLTRREHLFPSGCPSWKAA